MPVQPDESAATERVVETPGRTYRLRDEVLEAWSTGPMGESFYEPIAFLPMDKQVITELFGPRLPDSIPAGHSISGGGRDEASLPSASDLRSVADVQRARRGRGPSRGDSSQSDTEGAGGSRSGRDWSQLDAPGLAAEAQRRFQTDAEFHARCYVVDGIVESVTDDPMTDSQRWAARHAVAVALLLAEGGFDALGI